MATDAHEHGAPMPGFQIMVQIPFLDDVPGHQQLMRGFARERGYDVERLLPMGRGRLALGVSYDQAVAPRDSAAMKARFEEDLVELLKGAVRRRDMDVLALERQRERIEAEVLTPLELTIRDLEKLPDHPAAKVLGSVLGTITSVLGSSPTHPLRGRRP